MKVLHVYRTYFPDPPGGLQEAIRQICFATRPYDIESTVFTLSPQPVPGVLEHAEARIVRRRSWMAPASCDIGDLSAVSELARLARGSDLIHYHFPWPFADILHLLVRPRMPCVVTYHSDIVRQRGLMGFYRPLMRRFFRRVDRIVATSPNYVRTSAELQPYADKLEVIPLALDESAYPSPDVALLKSLRARFGDGFFFFVGVLRYYKGLHVLLEAVRETGLPTLIAGTGPEEEALRRQAAKPGHENVRFLGQVTDPEKAALMQLARAVVFPSMVRSEAFGVTLLEGAMWRRPLICCEIGTGTTYVNVDGETGIVVPPADPRSLREAMQRLAADQGFARRLGAGARARFEQLFSAPAMSAAYTDLYRRLTTIPHQ